MVNKLPIESFRFLLCITNDKSKHPLKPQIMVYYKTKIKEQAKCFHFIEGYTKISDDVLQQHKKIKKLYFEAMNILQNPSRNVLKDMQTILEFYESSNIYLILLLEEILKEPISRKKQIFILLDKLFKMFFIFDITRHNKSQLFHNYTLFKESKTNQTNFMQKCNAFAALSMPMGHLFISTFSAEYKEVYYPTQLIKRNTIFLNNQKRNYIFYLSCIFCEIKELPYCRIFFCGLFNRFFQSGYFIGFIEQLESQKQAYYVSLAEYH